MLLLSCVVFLTTPIRASEKPNVLFLAVDDMNDWVGFLGGYDGADAFQQRHLQQRAMVEAASA